MMATQFFNALEAEARTVATQQRER
jgi:hypothetical protein